MDRPQDRPRRARFKTALARKMRAEPTRAEYVMWWQLRRKAASGLRFRRQHPIGPYVVDFCCPAARLVIELDGSQHGFDQNAAYDARRTKWLEAEGYRVLRVYNDGFLSDPQSVLDSIWRAIKESGCPLPEPADAGSALPQGEGK